MKLDEYYQIKIVAGNLTIDGITAPIEMWKPLGIVRANWHGVEPDNQPARPMNDDPKVWDKIRELLARAKDSLPDASSDRVLNRAIALAANDRDLATVTQAMFALGRISVSVPSNINVWQHLKGEAPLQIAAKSLSELAKALTDKISQ